MPLEAEAQTVSLGSLATAADLCINMLFPFFFQPQYFLSEFPLFEPRAWLPASQLFNYLELCFNHAIIFLALFPR